MVRIWATAALPLLSFNHIALGLPSQSVKQCARKQCKGDGRNCLKPKAWYSPECAACYQKECLTDVNTAQYQEAECIVNVCNDHCQNLRNISPCKRCISASCKKYKEAGPCEKAKLESLHHKEEIEVFMRSSNTHQLKCDADGFYEQKQCDAMTGYCTCVDTTTGLNLPGTDFASTPEFLECDSSALHVEAVLFGDEDTNEQQKQVIQTRTGGASGNGPCSRKLKRMQANRRKFSEDDYPQCSENGFFKLLQCSSKTCWCVEAKTGNVMQLAGFLNTGVPSTEEDCQQQRGSNAWFQKETRPMMPITPPPRDNIFGIVVKQDEDSEAVSESNSMAPFNPFMGTGRSVKPAEKEAAPPQRPSILLRPASQIDFEQKSNGPPPPPLPPVPKRPGRKNMCWKVGGVCVDQQHAESCDEMGMLEQRRSKCYKPSQMCCRMRAPSDIEEAGDNLIQARVLEFDATTDAPTTAVVQQDSDQLQHHVCGFGDMHIRCLQTGSSCRRGRVERETLIQITGFQISDDDVSLEGHIDNCKQQCSESSECDNFTFVRDDESGNWACILRRQPSADVPAVFVLNNNPVPRRRRKRQGRDYACGGGWTCFSGTSTCQPLVYR